VKTVAETPGTLPVLAGFPPRLRACLRGARLIVHLLAGVMLVALVHLDVRGWLSRDRLTSWWNGELLKILHVRLSVRGQRLRGPRVIVSNHVSWLDISVIAASELTRFVSKSEVASWPIAGWLANAAGTFYIRRGAGGTKQLVEELKRHVSGQGSVVFFPEGTTTDGSSVARFQPRLFATAVETGAAVQPVALRYGRAADGSNIAAFIGDDTLAGNLLRLLQERELHVELFFCPAFHAQAGQDRAAVAAEAYASICGVVAPAAMRAQAAGNETAQTSLAA
jgi:1-acyl-sn-glycerol-3-phosphate acyltransferase